MGNLYRLNSLFELEISKPIKEITQNTTLLERNKLYEYLFLILSENEDYTIFSDNPKEELLEYWKKNRIKFGNVVITDTPYYADELPLDKNLPRDLKLFEWGKTSILDRHVLIKHIPKINMSGYINSKIRQTEWKESIRKNSLTSIICKSRLELEYSILKFPIPFIIKPEFGFSGIGNFLVKNELDRETILSKLEKLFSSSPSGVIIEEWVGKNRNLDFSGIFQLSHKKSELLTITKMLIDQSGIYRGTIIQRNFGEDFRNGLQNVVSRYLLGRSSYQGNMAMDGFVFSEGGTEKVQYMSEMNFRFSMGRVLYELHKKIGRENENCGLFFFPIKNKTITFRNALTDLEMLKAKYKINLLMVTPLSSAKSKLNPFIGIYTSSQMEISLEVVEEIRNLFA